MESLTDGYFGRYSVIPFGEGWILQDSRPDDPAYIFTRGRKRMYAAKILGEARSASAARVLVSVARRLSEQDKNRRKK